jgi:two-component system LytT family response regulator
MIRAVIIDDEVNSRDMLAGLLAQYCMGVRVEAATGGLSEGVSVLQQIRPEIVFWDVGTYGGNGFALQERMSGQNFEVIFTAVPGEQALRAIINTAATNYLLKPFRIDEVQTAVQKAEERVFERRGYYNRQAMANQLQQKQAGMESIAVPVNDGLQFIALNTIVRMEAHGSYTKIFCINSPSLLSSRSLKDYEDLLQTRNFFRPHHSHIINLLHLKKYYRGNGGYVTMNDGSVVDVSKRKKKQFLDLFDRNIFKITYTSSTSIDFGNN